MTWPVTVCACVAALVYCCTITHGPQLALEATLALLLAGYAGWLIYDQRSR